MSADVNHDMSALQRLARITGFLYLVIAVFGMFAPTVLQTLVLPGEAATTAHKIVDSRWLFGSSLVTWIALVLADAAVAVTLYLLLEPVSRALSLVAAAFRLLYAAIVGAGLINLFDAFLLLTSGDRAAGLETQQRQALALSSLATFGTGFLLALVFFGVHLLVLGFVLDRSRYVPRLLSFLLVGGGVGYIVHSLANFFLADQGGLASAVVLAPALVGELGLTAWLMVKGVNVRLEPATRNSFKEGGVAESVVATGGAR